MYKVVPEIFDRQKGKQMEGDIYFMEMGEELRTTIVYIYRVYLLYISCIFIEYIYNLSVYIYRIIRLHYNWFLYYLLIPICTITNYIRHILLVLFMLYYDLA